LILQSAYNSNFKLSTWLLFLKNRLEIASELITNDGTIWIHVGEDGMHYLKVLADSVFGQNNFVGTLPRKTREGKNDVPFNFSQDFDFILIYSKADRKDSVIQRKIYRSYIETDDFPNRPWRRGDIKQQKNYKERPNSYFDMVNPKTGKVYEVDKNAVWRVTKDTFQNWYNNGYIGFPDDYDFMNGEVPFRRSFKDEDDIKDKEKGPAVFSDYLLKDFTKQLMGKGRTAKNDIIEDGEFNYAKPESLMQQIIEVGTFEKDIVLDFFMGSATTQAVAMKMNRRFIGIEQMDYINTVSVPRLQKVMEGEQGGISKDVNWQGGGSFVYVELMEKSKGYLESVLEAKDTDSLKQIYQLMLDNVDLDFRADSEQVQEMLIDAISLADKKRLLVKVIDKNQLYYNYSEIDDANVRDLISDTDYAFNQSFYKEEEYHGQEDQ
ncbi:site-specific DNA-methyltransferase, partial [Jeotgalibaca dankookensis]